MFKIILNILTVALFGVMIYVIFFDLARKSKDHSK
jgi:hypothetical protein